VLAVSGGPDSVCLMHLVARLRGDRPVTVATVDHGLRPGSAREAEAVAGWCADLGLPHRVLAWHGPKPRTRIQEIARQERYRLLADFARAIGASSILTGHTLDDQAETILMRLLRGTGVGGLAGMRAEAEHGGVRVARPFLTVPKARLIATCQAEGWPYLEDPSNADPRFLRARLRGSLMPALAAEGLTPERLSTLARRAARAEDALAARADSVLAAARLPAPEGRLALDGALLAAEPDAILLGVLARAIVEVTGGKTRAIRLERWEARILGDLRRALAAGEGVRMTLGGALLTLGRDRCLVLNKEPPRRSRSPESGREGER
jgi:tRNA(Ile)-lysidine synthase